MEHLRPFRPRIDPHRDRVELERAVTLVELARVDDPQDQGSTGRGRPAGPVEDLLAVGRELEFVDPLGERLLLAGLEVEPLQRRLPARGRPRPGRTPTRRM